MYIKREEHALQTTIENLQNPSKSKYNTEYNTEYTKTNDRIDIESSCESIINYVIQRSKHDPLLSNDNHFKKGIVYIRLYPTINRKIAIYIFHTENRYKSN